MKCETYSAFSIAVFEIGFASGEEWAVDKFAPPSLPT